MNKSEEKKRVWKNLERGLCPKCGGPLKQEQRGAPLFCQKKVEECGFLIGEKKCEEILAKMNDHGNPR